MVCDALSAFCRVAFLQMFISQINVEVLLMIQDGGRVCPFKNDLMRTEQEKKIRPTSEPTLLIK